MNDITTTYTEQLVSEGSEHLLFKYYPNLPQGSSVKVSTQDTDGLEKYFNGECYEFLLDFFGEKKRIFLSGKRFAGRDEEFGGDLFEFTLSTIEDVETA